MKHVVGLCGGKICVGVAKLTPDAKIPTRGTEQAAGYDLYALEHAWIRQSTVTLVRTGIALELPRGYEVQIRPRSSMTKNGVIAVHGTIDSDYRGEIMVALYALTGAWEARRGDRIAQLVIQRLPDVRLVERDHREMGKTERGAKGFGSTGI